MMSWGTKTAPDISETKYVPYAENCSAAIKYNITNKNADSSAKL